MELTGTVSDADYAQITRAVMLRQRGQFWSWFALVMGLMAFSLLVDEVRPQPLRWLPGACGLWLFWLAFLRPAVSTRPLHQRFKRVTLSDVGVECFTEGGFSAFDWARVTGVVRQRGLVVLVLENDSYVPLLRSWAKDEATWAEALAFIPARLK